MMLSMNYTYIDNEDHDLHGVWGCSKIILLTLLLTDHVFKKYVVFIFTLYDLIVITSELAFVENKAIVLNGN